LNPGRTCALTVSTEVADVVVDRATGFTLKEVENPNGALTESVTSPTKLFLP